MKCSVIGCRREATMVYVATVSRRAFIRCKPHSDKALKELKKAAKKHFKSERSLNQYLKSVDSRTGEIA
jgi:ribosomal protein L31E